MLRIYTVPAKNGQRMHIGDVFGDHGKKMMVTAIGEVYRSPMSDMPGKRVIDVTAVQVASDGGTANVDSLPKA